MIISAVGRVLPVHGYRQDELTAAMQRVWAGQSLKLERLQQIHQNVQVAERHLALPLEELVALHSFTEANQAYIRVGTELAQRALEDALSHAGLGAGDLDHLFLTTTTGVATPSIDALLMNRMELRRDLKRTPLFGLGCVAGAAGIARAADCLAGRPGDIAALISVELCSLTAQWDDTSLVNYIASGLFGDGAAAVILQGDDRPAEGPRVLATRSVFYPETEHLMGWEIGSHGFRLLLSADVPRVIAEHLGDDVDRFLADQGLERDALSSFVCHPGGPRVLEAIQQALGLDPQALAPSWQSLKRIGNLSSASILFILGDVMADHRPQPGSLGLMLAMGPAFCSELLLLEW